ncbi:NACHT domain-containing protein [Lentzea sp. NPDC004789]
MADDDLSGNSIGVSRGIAFQAHTVHGNVYVNTSPSPDDEPPCDPPATWTETTDLPAAIAQLLWAQQQTADLLPYQLPGARTPALGTIYVRQDLGGAVEDAPTAHSRPAPMLDESGRLVETPVVKPVRVAVRPPSKQLRAALDADSHLLVLGGPGQGKSTLTLRLCADIAGHWTVRTDADAPLREPVIPLRVTARTLAKHLGSSFPQALADSAFAEHGRYLSNGPLDPALFACRVAGCRWLLLVDALDEVTDSALRATLVHTLSAWASRDAYRVLLTTRPTEGGALAALQRAGAPRYELQPFDAEALRRFAHNWFEEIGNDHADRFLHQIREAHLGELVEVPLLATIAAIVFEQHSDRPLPGNQYELYESYLSFIRSPHRVVEAFERHRGALVEHLGRIRLTTESSLAVAAQDWALRNDVHEIDGLVAYLLNVGPFIKRGNDIAFLHQSFAEHVAATGRARELPPEFTPEHQDFAELLHEAYPEETGVFARAVLLHYAHLHTGEADRMLRWLHSGGSEEHLLAARLLARHLPAGRPAVEEFLVAVRAWAMTTRYPARLILREASRATRYAGLIEWLADLMHSSAAPQESKVEAAVALAVRLRCAHTDAAVVLLKSVVDDRSVSVDDCLVAAEALAHSGSSDREAAERGLRAVLTDPNSSGADCRSAAVVLSAFDPDSRAFAISALERLVSDADTPVLDLVEAATGLLEIEPEFHDLSARVFLQVLEDQANTKTGRHKATVGLASLGLREQAAEALLATATNRRFPSDFSANLLAMLALLGPLHLAEARERVLAELDEEFASSFDRLILAPELARLGLRERSAAVLREVLADPATIWNHFGAAANYLAELGPACYEEAAAHIEGALGSMPPKGYDYAFELRTLAGLGESHRSRALERMNALLADPGADAETRCQVASDLAQASPERHADIVRHLMAIIRAEPDPSVLVKAWDELFSLGPELCGQAKLALVSLARKAYDGVDAPRTLGWMFSSCGAADRSMAANVLVDVATDETRGVRTRVSAVRGLQRLGRGFHRRAAELLCDLIEARLPVNLNIAASGFVDSGPGVRAVVVRALHQVLHVERPNSSRAWFAVQALDHLGHRPQHEVLRAIVADESALVWRRTECALMLADEDESFLSAAMDLHERVAGQIAITTWRSLAAKAARAGADVHSRLRAMLADPAKNSGARAAAASLLGAEGLGELRAQADDPYLDVEARSDAWRFLAAADPVTLAEAVAFHRTRMDDPDESIRTRCVMALALVKLDRSFTSAAISALWRWAESPLLDAGDRARAALRLSTLDEPLSRRLLQLVIGLCGDPGLRGDLGVRLARVLPRPHRTDVERALLTGYSEKLRDRMPVADAWGDIPLRREAEVVVRDALTDPASSRGERVHAAVELARLSEQLIPEAVEILLADGSPVALSDAADLGEWPQVLGRVLDESLPRRHRVATALRLGGRSSVSAVRDMLARQPCTSWRDRVDVLACLENYGELRTLRDDPSGAPVQRWWAASKLVELAPADRAAAAQLYRDLATDPVGRPPLRLRIARDLAKLGVQGRAEAVVIIRGIAADECLPVLTRSGAARWLSDEVPTSRMEVEAIQRELVAAASTHLQRIHVLRSISRGPSWDAIDELLSMVADRELTPRVRLWCARSVVEQRKDLRDRCAVVAREISFDVEAPWHIRVRAATCLARWSELMREDARALLVRLRDCPAR